VNKYSLVQADNAEGLCQAIGQLIEQGWKPQGGISVMALRNELGHTIFRYTQAMFKHEVIIR
jgi:uncharacterized protein DUF1737